MMMRWKHIQTLLKGKIWTLNENYDDVGDDLVTDSFGIELYSFYYFVL